MWYAVLQLYDNLFAAEPFFQNPLEWASQLLLGLESINSSKNEALTEDEKAQSFLSGTKLIETAFKANNRSAAAANALCELFLRKGNYSRVRIFLYPLSQTHSSCFYARL